MRTDTAAAKHNGHQSAILQAAIKYSNSQRYSHYCLGHFVDQD